MNQFIHFFSIKVWLVVILSLSLPFMVSAEVHLPVIFGDHMVLQQKTMLPVWGWGAPGEKVTVIFKGQKQSAVAGLDGAWRINLAPIPANDTSDTLTVSGENNTLVFHDVLVGEVWVASGQSNMEFGIQKDSRGKETIARADDDKLRFFFVPWATALQPRTNIEAIVPPSPLNGKWVVCSPQTLGSNWASHGFSAVGFYFAQEIRRTTGRAVGIIATYKGGTPAQAWTSIAGLKKEPSLAHYVSAHDQIVQHLAQSTAEYPTQYAQYKIALKAWNMTTAQAHAGGSVSGQTAPKAPVPPDGGFSAPANLFHGMVSPLIPYAIAGVIWYQGESNGDNLEAAQEYATLFPAMVNDWRAHWGQGDFPFLFVQLPNFANPAKVPSEGRWPWVRDAQLKTLSLPNTGMAVTIDVGEADNLHPPDKIYVGQRLALAARHIAYGESLVYSGPIYDSMSLEGNKIRLSFKQAADGLKIGLPPSKVNGDILPIAPKLLGFGIAGSDKKFVWAEAAIEGNSVVVYSDKVPHPIAVRYDWAQNPSGNLYNQENLPASPFRTDNWTSN